MRIIETSFKALYQEYLESGLTVRDFCSNQDFAVSTFYRWQKLLKETDEPKGFVPLVIDKQTAVSNCNHHEGVSQVKEYIAEENDLEFTFPNGTKLQVKGSVDLTLLKTIVHLYWL